MTLSPRCAVLGLLFGLATIAHASPAPDPDLARNLAATCTGCHGTNGATQGNALPPLAGQPKDQLLQSLKDFKAGKRPATIMTQLAKGYTDEQLEILAAYFAAQKK